MAAPVPLPSDPSPSPVTGTPPAASFEIESIRSNGSDRGAPDKTALRFYQALMFATGATAFLASYLMFTAVTGISPLLFMGVAAFAGGCAAMYRVFVPAPELTRKK